MTRLSCLNGSCHGSPAGDPPDPFMGFFFFFCPIRRIRIDENPFFFKSSPSQLELPSLHAHGFTASRPSPVRRSFSHHSLSRSPAAALSLLALYLLPFSALPLSLCDETLRRVRTFSAMIRRADDRSLSEETLRLISHACREWGFLQVLNHGLRVFADDAEWGFFRYVGSGYGFLE
jgi:hypothetical protein